MKTKRILSQMLLSSRPISWINTAFPFAAGYLATGGAINLYFWVAVFYFLVPYNFLVYIVNDVFDYESDIKNPRKNSIEGGLLPPSTHSFMLVATAVFNAIFLIYLFAVGTGLSGLILLLITLGAISYSAPPLRLKERPFLDSINSSLHFAGPLVFAFILTGWQTEYLLYIVAFFLWGCASHAFGAVQDIIPDREANISSVATSLGASRTVLFSLIGYMGTGICLLISGWPAVIACVPLLLYIFMVIPYLNLSDQNSFQANKAWRKFLWMNQISGFVVTIVLIASFYFA